MIRLEDGTVLLLLTRGPLHQPENVFIIRGNDIEVEGDVRLQDGNGAGIFPSFDFGMTIHKG